MKTKSAAIVTIKGAPAMTAKGRRAIAAWLRKQAEYLLNNHKQFSKRYVARWLYTED